MFQFCMRESAIAAVYYVLQVVATVFQPLLVLLLLKWCERHEKGVREVV